MSSYSSPIILNNEICGNNIQPQCYPSNPTGNTICDICPCL